MTDPREKRLRELHEQHRAAHAEAQKHLGVDEKKHAAAYEAKRQARAEIDKMLQELYAEGKHVTADLEIKGEPSPETPGRIDAITYAGGFQPPEQIPFKPPARR